MKLLKKLLEITLATIAVLMFCDAAKRLGGF